MNLPRARHSAHSWNVKSGRYPGGHRPKLVDGSRVAVMGGGPAGSLFSYYLLEMAEMAGLQLELDLWDPKDFMQAAPRACDVCGGIVSEALVQTLAADGINLPPSVVQRGIDAYVMHMDAGHVVRIATPLQEKRIAAVHRGLGRPRGVDTTLDAG